MAKTIQGFNTRLKEAMNVKRMKQVELSEKTGIGKSSISHYINGTHSPTTDRVYLIAKALNVSEAWLLGYDVPMTAEEKKEKDKEDFLDYLNIEMNVTKSENNKRLISVLEKYVEKLDAEDLDRLGAFVDYQKIKKRSEIIQVIAIILSISTVILNLLDIIY